ncbi:MAG: hypothetical protein EZS28_045007 [Streblomastix strix]|uniref:Uncharacterized protein n=1 Tax=Streblomastix strix TaxID=222440 RepID=A0A5J4TLS6_9EUKA|nr:MAG: hypothetical protein EZS28_045007 [Streblomastix strix]
MKQPKYTDFGSTSNEAACDTIECISDIISMENKQEIKPSGLFGLCIDESADISSLNQLSTLIKCIGPDKQIHSSFLDMRPLSSLGATADNIFATFVEMGKDQDSNLNNLIGICVDGASNMIGCRHSMTSKIVEKFQSVVIIHYCAH